MIILKTKEEIAIIKEGGLILSDILSDLVDRVAPGVTTEELDAHAESRMRKVGGEPSFKGYQSTGDERPFPSTVCMSLNNEVVHAPAVPSRTLKDGDMFKMDIGLRYKGLCTDMAVTVPVGSVTPERMELMRATKQSLLIAVEKCREGAWVSEIGKAVDKFVRRKGYSTVKDLVGHGVGKFVHEDPRIPNYFDPYLPPVRIARGMVLALEPMVNIGKDAIDMLDDEWTIVTADGSMSAHYELTLAITENGTEIMTPLPTNIKGV